MDYVFNCVVELRSWSIIFIKQPQICYTCEWKKWHQKIIACFILHASCETLEFEFLADLTISASQLYRLFTWQSCMLYTHALNCNINHMHCVYIIITSAVATYARFLAGCVTGKRGFHGTL